MRHEGKASSRHHIGQICSKFRCFSLPGWGLIPVSLGRRQLLAVLKDEAYSSWKAMGTCQDCSHQPHSFFLRKFGRMKLRINLLRGLKMRQRREKVKVDPKIFRRWRRKCELYLNPQFENNVKCFLNIKVTRSLPSWDYCSPLFLNAYGREVILM